MINIQRWKSRELQSIWCVLSLSFPFSIHLNGVVFNKNWKKNVEWIKYYIVILPAIAIKANTRTHAHTCADTLELPVDIVDIGISHANLRTRCNWCTKWFEIKAQYVDVTHCMFLQIKFDWSNQHWIQCATQTEKHRHTKNTLTCTFYSKQINKSNIYIYF